MSRTKIHALKCWPEFFSKMAKGTKTFDVRKNDRHFQTGDAIMLEEWDPKTEEYTGAVMLFQVTYILVNGPELALLKQNNVVLGLKRL